MFMSFIHIGHFSFKSILSTCVLPAVRGLGCCGQAFSRCRGWASRCSDLWLWSAGSRVGPGACTSQVLRARSRQLRLVAQLPCAAGLFLAQTPAWAGRFFSTREAPQRAPRNVVGGEVVLGATQTAALTL